jgi:hypothetical protein
MTVRDPWERLAEGTRYRTFVRAAIAAVILTILLGRIGAPLKTPAAPDGILSYELAGTYERSAAILASWDEPVRESARLSLAVDYFYIVAYALAISLGCAIVAGRLRGRRRDLSTVAVVLSWAILVAGLLDAVENAALLRELASGPGATMARIAMVASITKFTFVAASLPCALLALIPVRVAPAGP